VFLLRNTHVVGKVTSLRGWRWQHREGSSPFFRTNTQDTLRNLDLPHRSGGFSHSLPNLGTRVLRLKVGIVESGLSS